jgi:hypothetical protein
VGLTTTDDKGKLKTQLKIDAPDSANAIVTAIDMVQGDVTNFVPAKFWTPENAAVLDFHKEQVNFGKDVVNHNLRLASEVMEKLLGLLNK